MEYVRVNNENLEYCEEVIDHDRPYSPASGKVGTIRQLFDGSPFHWESLSLVGYCDTLEEARAAINQRLLNRDRSYIEQRREEEISKIVEYSSVQIGDKELRDLRQELIMAQEDAKWGQMYDWYHMSGQYDRDKQRIVDIRGKILTRLSELRLEGKPYLVEMKE